MASNLRVDQILPTTGTNIGIGTAGGNIIVGGATTEVVVNGGLHVTGNVQGGTASFLNISAGFFNGFHVDGGAPASSLTVDNLGNTVVGSGHSLYINNGNLVFSTSGTGIDFQNAGISSNTASAHILNDYEEGTFTLTLTDASSGLELTNYGGAVSNATIARYIRVGKVCHLEFHAPYFANSGNIGNVNVSGSAPFISSKPAILRAGGPMRGFSDATKNLLPVVVIAGAGRGDGGANFYLHNADEFSNSSGYDVNGQWNRDNSFNAPGLFISGSYIIADGA